MSSLDKKYDLPLKYDLYLYRGDTYIRGVRLKDEGTGDYIDLTDHEPLCQVRETMVSDNILFTMIAGLADQDNPATVGMTYLEVPESAWERLPILPEPTKVGEYDFELLGPTGKKVTYIYGDVYLKGDTSR